MTEPDPNAGRAKTNGSEDRNDDQYEDVLEYETDPSVWRFVLKGALAGLAIGVVLAVVGPHIGLSQPEIVLVAAPVLVALIIQLVRAGVVDVLPSLPEPTPEVVVPEYFVRLRQLERRLEGSVRHSSDYDWTIRPLLTDLIDGRLQHQHSVNYRTDPVRARTILGEQLWDIMMPPPDQPVRSLSKKELTELVTRLEQL